MYMSLHLYNICIHKYFCTFMCMYRHMHRHRHTHMFTRIISIAKYKNYHMQTMHFVKNHYYLNTHVSIHTSIYSKPMCVHKLCILLNNYYYSNTHVSAHTLIYSKPMYVWKHVYMCACTLSTY